MFRGWVKPNDHESVHNLTLHSVYFQFLMIIYYYYFH